VHMCRLETFRRLSYCRLLVGLSEGNKDLVQAAFKDLGLAVHPGSEKGDDGADPGEFFENVINGLQARLWVWYIE